MVVVAAHVVLSVVLFAALVIEEHLADVAVGSFAGCVVGHAELVYADVIVEPCFDQTVEI
jgi:hypothetical protein